MLIHVREAYQRALTSWRFCKVPVRDSELVQELAEVAILAAEDGDWHRAVRAARAVAREAAEVLGEPHLDWADFVTQAESALESERAPKTIPFTKVSHPRDERTTMTWRP